MRKILFLVIIGAIFCSIAGCSVNASKLSDKYAKEFVESVQFARHSKSGLCFAVVASRKTASTDSTGIGITCVPCEAVQHLLVGE